jgi:Flp pilus assembly protein TadG
MLRRIVGMLARLKDNRRGNVLMLMGFSVIPLTLSTGMAIDYSRAARLQTRMNAAADAAALAAVTRPMMKQTTNAGKLAAENMFNGQVKELNSLIYDKADLKVTVVEVPGAIVERVATVTYTAKSVNAFGGLVGMKTIEIGGVSKSVGTAAPDIDFYVALDTSSSMALPTTTAGLAKMYATVSCAFACHSNKIEQYVGAGRSMPGFILDTPKFSIVKSVNTVVGTSPNQRRIIDSNGSYVWVNRDTTNALCRNAPTGNRDMCVYNADGTYVDSYWYALNQDVRLRVTEEKIAAKDLMTLAQSYAEANGRTYRAGLYTFDHTTNFKTISNLTSNLSAVSDAAGTIDAVIVNDKAGNGRPPNGTGGTEYLFTSYDRVLRDMLAIMPLASGNGTSTPGDTPQAFLFMVTDGMSDENIGSGRTRSAMLQDHINRCTAIKNRGIKIAILYTEYTVESIANDEASQRAIATAAIPNIAPQLTKCASPGLMYTVKTDESISQTLQALFKSAVSMARITK